MRYIKKFKESVISEISEILIDCKEILIDFTDMCHFVDVRLKTDSIIVEIGDELSRRYLPTKMIKLQEFEETLDHLFNYLSSKGYSLASNSHVINNNWESLILCPDCGSKNIKKWYDGDDYLATCNKCRHESDEADFYTQEHPVTESDIRHFIRDKYWVQCVYLVFEKK